ncbi:Transcriptional regulatory protein DcuR [Sporomusa silvacetica DSM 10669]|uniref:Transcriptional regulatory protein n=1 Tax=Sporomusa silvacetica DSM 10669 TaxID=1123289 RepID=A0ABZ3IJ49_9FIRM|nr:response regulator [Sporomusa silvacetica]OZC22104.1 transcriptional regulatory protein DcuR [Sporomusa silvacetica DSM 10669]
MGVDIVIVEDDPMVMELHRQYISQVKGFRLVGQAANAADGYELIVSIKPQLVILDVYMPGESGIDLLRRVRAAEINIDVILVTAAHRSETIQQGMQCGVVDYIIKPFTLQRFKKALKCYQQYIERLNKTQQLCQKDIDCLRGTTPGESIPNSLAELKENIPKGLDKATLEAILTTINKQPDYFTTSEIARLVGVSRVTARRYLNYLTDNGWLKGILSYGPVGRPLHKYTKDDSFFL